MGCCWIILRTGRETSTPSLSPISLLYALVSTMQWCMPATNSTAIVYTVFLPPFVIHDVFFLHPLFFPPCYILRLQFLLYVCQGQIQPLASLCASDLLLREDPIQVKACFNAFLAESFCTSHCVMCANAQHPPSASPQCFSCCRHTHISAVFSPLTSSLRLFISSSLPHCLPFCCTLTTFLLFILAWLHPLTPPFYTSQLHSWLEDLQLIFWLAAL